MDEDETVLLLQVAILLSRAPWLSGAARLDLRRSIEAVGRRALGADDASRVVPPVSADVAVRA